MPGEGILSTFSLPLAVLKFLGGKLFATMFYIFIIKGTKRTLILSSKKQTNHKLIIIKGKKTRILSKEPTNHKLSKEPKKLMKRNQDRFYQRDQANQDGYYQRDQANQDEY